MDDKSNIRIDKYLWAVRLYKTRSIATDACKSGKILIHGYPVKPSRIINVNDVFMLKSNPVVYTYRVKELLANRVGPKLVENYLENLTPAEELLKLDMNINPPILRREKGAGRPTKKERRDIDKLNLLP